MYMACKTCIQYNEINSMYIDLAFNVSKYTKDN